MIMFFASRFAEGRVNPVENSLRSRLHKFAASELQNYSDLVETRPIHRTVGGGGYRRKSR
jgi:hypothetical protein